ncbi:MAG: ATP-binding protein [Patescibacteria group bacterium]
MINKNILEITLADIEDLKKNSISEGKTIEYKKDLNISSDSEKKEFLKDLTSFANTAGGDLIFGIEEKGGIPENIEGITVVDENELKGRLENLIRDSIEPRIKVDYNFIDIGDNKILIIRLAKSWNSPHRVTHRGHNKFYGRNANGKYEFDTNELRDAFNLSEVLLEKFNDFKADRIIKITSNESPMPTEPGAKIIMLFIPLSAFTPNTSYDLNELKKDPSTYRPLYSGAGWSGSLNFEGLIGWSGIEDKKTYTYLQIYRNGIIEAAEGLMLSMPEKRTGNKFIPHTAFEEKIIEGFERILSMLDAKLGVPLPIFFSLTLVNIKGYRMSQSNYNDFFMSDRINQPLNKNILSLPEITINDFSVNAATVLKPQFDLIWNAFGIESSPNYDEQGNWVGR